MGRNKKQISDVLKSYIRRYGANIFKSENDVLFCIPCNKRIAATRKSQVWIYDFINFNSFVT